MKDIRYGGPKTDICGIPWLCGKRGEYDLSIIIEILRIVRYEVKKFKC